MAEYISDALYNELLNDDAVDMDVLTKHGLMAESARLRHERMAILVAAEGKADPELAKRDAAARFRIAALKSAPIRTVDLEWFTSCYLVEILQRATDTLARLDDGTSAEPSDSISDLAGLGAEFMDYEAWDLHSERDRDPNIVALYETWRTLSEKELYVFHQDAHALCCNPDTPPNDSLIFLGDLRQIAERIICENYFEAA